MNLESIQASQEGAKGSTRWRGMGNATQVAYRDRLYISAYYFLWCIGKKSN